MIFSTPAAFSIAERDVSGVYILDLTGRLVLGAPVSTFREKIAEAVAAGKNRVLLNFSGSHHIDSSGIGALVEAHTTIREISGAVKLLHVSQRSAELLLLTRLTTLFEIFDDEQVAIDSFFPERAVPKFDILEFVQSQEKEAESGSPADAQDDPSV